jgi:hypothetical protein
VSPTVVQDSGFTQLVIRLPWFTPRWAVLIIEIRRDPGRSTVT